jgi:predicted RNA-binding Zn ribbon-like protein
VASTLQNEAKPESKGKEFELIGGHPVLDLVNTLDWRFRESGPEELISDYNDLIRFIVQSGFVSTARARKLVRSVPDKKAEEIVRTVHELREAAANLLYAAVDKTKPQASALERLEDFFKEAGRHLELRWTGLKLERELPQPSALPELPLWLLSLRASEFMTSDQMHLLRACGSPECRWLFVDTSKNHTRRWCDMKICGNRMKARRFKAQHGH